MFLSGFRNEFNLQIHVQSSRNFRQKLDRGISRSPFQLADFRLMDACGFGKLFLRIIQLKPDLYQSPHSGELRFQFFHCFLKFRILRQHLFINIPEFYTAWNIFATMSSDEFKKGQKISPLH